MPRPRFVVVSSEAPATSTSGRARSGGPGGGRHTMRLDELKVVVTGGAQGMGRHFARRLAESGASVVAADIKDDALASLAEECKGLPGKLFVRKLDVSVEQQCIDAVGWAYETM